MPKANPRCLVLTGASGSGKTTLARSLEPRVPGARVCFFDSIGVPDMQTMAAYGSGHQPGGAWQRAVTLRWVELIASYVRTGDPVLFEGQMRIAFILEAFATYGVQNGHIVLVDCDDATRRNRLMEDRRQPGLAHEDMFHWATYLREEAVQSGCEILDTGRTPFDECCSLLLDRLRYAGQ